MKGVVHLWSAEGNAVKEMKNADTCLKKDSNIASGLYLMQALAQVQKSVSPELWFITRGTQAVETSDSTLGLTDSPLWGFGRVIGREHPELKCSLVDLDPNASELEASQLLSELESAINENQIAFH